MSDSATFDKISGETPSERCFTCFKIFSSTLLISRRLSPGLNINRLPENVQEGPLSGDWIVPELLAGNMSFRGGSES